MLYIYDNAIQQDLADCINPTGGANNIVKVIEPEGALDIIAQMQEDHIDFPFVCLARSKDTHIDTARTNFSMQHKGQVAGYNAETNEVYLERILPVELSYTLNILATNTADIDEFTKELMFRYMQTYFITTEINYEVKRSIRFGVRLDPGSIEKSSGTLDYIKNGTLYQASMNLICDGAVLVSYVPKKVERLAYEVYMELNQGQTLNIDEIK